MQHNTETCNQKDRQTQMLWQLLSDSGMDVMDALISSFGEEEVKANFVAEYKERQEEQKEIDESTCEICEVYDEGEVMIAEGYDGTEMRVCKDCNINGVNYSGWGGYENKDEPCEKCGCDATVEYSGIWMCNKCRDQAEDEDENIRLYGMSG